LKSSCLFLLVEGPDDQRFFENTSQKILEENCQSVLAWPYAEKSPKKVTAFLRSIERMRAEYIFFADFNRSACVTAKKEKLGRRYRNLDLSRTVIVIPEIEAWYLAGIGREDARSLGIRKFRHTNGMTKEAFERLRPRKFDSTIDYMQELLGCYSVETACKKNESFEYFAEKFLGL